MIYDSRSCGVHDMQKQIIFGETGVWLAERVVDSASRSPANPDLLPAEAVDDGP